MKRLLLSLTILLSLQATFGQSKSLLWEISGNGLAKPSYLYGTMHVSDKIAFHLTDSFFIALKQADVIALESNPEHWIENDFGNPDESGNYEYYEGSDYNYYGYGSDFYRDATDIFIPDYRTYASTYGEDSWLINGYLYRYSDQRGDYGEETYLDLFIFQCGKKLSKEIAALEKEQEVLKLLQKAYDKPEDEDKEAESAAFMEKEKMRNALEEDDKSLYELVDEAYRDGDLERLDSLEIISSPSPQFRKYFIDDRNVNMVRRMDSIMRAGRTVFTGIGAAHLPGKMGAITLLREMGYTVRPVMGKVTNKSIKEKDKIDAIIYNQQSSTQYASDSLFTVVCPGKLYDIGGYLTNKYYLYPDMANSAYYAVLRVAHHSYLNVESTEDVYNEIERMLYESIPGDIVSQTPFTANNGWPGIDVVSKTRRGNYIHIKIIVSPLETLIFKASGLGEFVINAKEPQAFFNSIKFRSYNGKWSRYSPSWGNFAVKLPENRIAAAVEEGSSVIGDEPVAMCEGADGKDRYLVNVYYLNDNKYIEQDSFELERLPEMFVDPLDDQNYKKQSSAYSTYKGYPAMESVWKGNSGYMHYKTVIRGPYYYTLCAFTESDKRPDNYFESLELTDMVYSRPFSTYNDTALFFTVNTIVPAPDTLLTLEEIEYNYYGENDYGYSYDDEDEELGDEYLSSTQYAIFSSEVSPECIFVQYHKYHDYRYFKNKTEFWSSFDSTYAGSGLFRMTRRKFTDMDSVQSLEFLLTDTASTRGIYKKFIQKDNMLLHISTCMDTIAPASEFIRQFYATIMPSDSVQGRSIFESPASLYLEALNNEDSIVRKRAINSIHVVNLDDNDAPGLISYMEGSRFKSMKMDDRTEFITALSELNHPMVVPALKKIYMDAGDSANLQTTVLDALTDIHTKPAIQAFIELLYIETPLAKKGYSLGWMFNGLYDSIGLCKDMFPALFDFTSFPEYQFPVYRLLTELVIHDSTLTKLYAAHSKQLITQASAELKRNLSDDDEDDEGNSYNRYSSNYEFTNLRDITDNSKEADKYFFGSELDDEFAWNYGYSLFNNDGQDKEKPIKYDWASSLQDYYSVLLLPYYSDPQVKKYYDRILRSQDKELKMNTALTMLQGGLPVPDSIFVNLLKDNEMRYDIASTLIEMGRKDKIDPTYCNQEKLSYAFLFDYALTKKEDSVEFITKRYVKTADTEGYIYFYKSKLGKEKGWSLDCTGVQPEDTTAYNVEPLFVHYGSIILDDENLEEKIDEIIKNVALLGRARVQITFEDKQNSYDYYD